jgi:hypothetical protein
MSDQLTDPAVRGEVVSPVSLVIPCRAEYVSLCRLVVGALGPRDMFDDDVVADLKVIVTEACNCFLAVASGGAAGPVSLDSGCTIRLEFDSQPDAFRVSLFSPQHRGVISWLEQRDPMSEAGLGLTILKALTDELVETDDGPAGSVLKLTKHL